MDNTHYLAVCATCSWSSHPVVSKDLVNNKLLCNWLAKTHTSSHPDHLVDIYTVQWAASHKQPPLPSRVR